MSQNRNSSLSLEPASNSTNGGGKAPQSLADKEQDDEEPALYSRLEKLSYPGSDYTEWKTTAEELVQYQIAKYGEKSDEVIQTLHSLGRSNQQIGKYDEAAAYYSRYIEFTKKLYGERSAAAAKAIEELAKLNVVQKNWADAISNYDQALAIRLENMAKKTMPPLKLLVI